MAPSLLPAALYAAVLETRGYVVGQANAPSGLHRYEGEGRWSHSGWCNVRSFGLAFDPARPAAIFMAAGNGVFRSLDAGQSWRVTTGWRITEVLDVAVDPHAPGMVYAATAFGIWRSPDRGETWEAASDGIPSPIATFVQAVEVDSHRRGHVIAGSEHGLFRSTDGGQRWTSVGPEGVAVRDVQQSRVVPDLWLAGTEAQGVLLSTDGGVSWTPGSDPVAGQTIYAVALDPSAPERMAAAGYRTGVYVSTDGGRCWQPPAAEAPTTAVHALAFDPTVAGRLWIGTAGDGVFYSDDLSRRWVDAGLPEAYRQRMRAQWRTYTPYRGDTENHWVMYYASLYLITQLYPDESAEHWFNGRSSRENFEEAHAYLLHWIDLTTTRGQGEFDSPHYLCFFLAPLAMLYAFAEDPAMRRRAGMMLDYLIADFGVDTLNGLYAGAFSRIYPEPTLERWKNGSTTFAWLLFGTAPFQPHGVNVLLPRAGYRPHGVAAILAMSGYRPPEVVYRMATDRSRPYVQKALKRTRHRIRYSDVRNAPVYKYLYMSRDYAVGSIQGGLLQPIQQHTWEVLWAIDDPLEGFNVLFTVHPYSSGVELGMYFPEEPKLLTDAVVQAEKGTYDSPDKWTGASPYEQVVQHEDALVVLYDISPGTRFPHVSGFFSRTLAVREEDASGWIFARGGRAMIAFYPLAPYTWRDEPGGHGRLHSPYLKNGAVVQVAPASAYPSFAAFKEAVRALLLETETEPVARVRFTTLRGDTLGCAYGEPPTLNGTPVDYAGWKLFDGPFLYAEKDSKKLEMRHGALRRLLDFDTLTVYES